MQLPHTHRLVARPGQRAARLVLARESPLCIRALAVELGCLPCTRQELDLVVPEQLQVPRIAKQMAIFQYKIVTSQGQFSILSASLIENSSKTWHLYSFWIHAARSVNLQNSSIVAQSSSFLIQNSSFFNKKFIEV